MWIETEIKGRFTTKSGDEMVSFAAKREDGRTWAAPQWLVSKGLGGAAQPGLAVCIEVVRERVSRVQRRTHQTSGASLAAGGPRATTSSGSPRPQEANRGGAQQASGQVLPYGFVPIAVERAVIDSPVWHDGTCGGDLLSGEILCELEALTPLLAGNARYQAGTADRQRLRSWGYDGAAENKQIAEPLRLPDGRVVIAGTALKGMIRHSLGALTSAPMERVAEHHFSYRPNLDFNDQRVKERYVVRPAIITSAKNGGWEIEVFADARAVLFVRQDAEEVIRKASSNGIVSGEVAGVEQEKIQRHNGPPRITSHLVPSRASMPFCHRLATYNGGIDGKGLMAAAFQKKDNENLDGRYVYKKNDPRNCRGPFTYDLALVPQESACTLEITAQLYRRYLADQQQILANNQIGHLTAHPLEVDVAQIAKSIKMHSEFVPGQLIYVELTTDSNGKVERNSKVISCGHHFRYRWAYTSSVRNRNGPRACLTPLADERSLDVSGQSKDDPPKRLTGARLLFGYVRDDETNPIGKGAFERMAGRIAINHAVSEETLQFLGQPGNGYCVPLRILGQPKASAWEFYLQQPADQNKPPATYGDHPGDAGGELSGRKFYRHQTSVSQAGIEAQGDEVTSDQATLARFICAPKTRFKFAIRFARLRDWELGALLAVLEPHRIARGGMREQFAHKLGLGRPLGMGSVRITPKRFRIRLEKDVRFFDEDEGERRVESALKSLHVKVASADVDNWLDAHEFIDRGPLGYPLGESRVNGKTVTTIYAWHTNLRREYSKLRREEGAAWSQLHGRIRKATIRRREQRDGGE